MYPEETLVKLVMEERMREAAARHRAAEALRGTDGDVLPTGRSLLTRTLDRYRHSFMGRPRPTAAGCMEGGER